MTRSGADDRMTASVIADIDVRDPDACREHVALVPAALQPYGGRFLVRGGAAMAIRHHACAGSFVLVEGAG